MGRMGRLIDAAKKNEERKEDKRILRVKIFDGGTGRELEEKINDFIIDKEIIDIQYQHSCSTNNDWASDTFSAMIQYWE